MGKKPNGGAAFPFPEKMQEVSYPEGARWEPIPDSGSDGISKRQYYAAMSMMGRNANPTSLDGTYAYSAEMAFMDADAMIEFEEGEKDG